MNLGRKLTNCRMCDSTDLYEFLDLGFLPPADRILNDERMNEPEIHFPLKVAQCQNCGLTQLTYVVAPEILYGEAYSYESSITETGKKHFFDMADSILEKFALKNNDLIIDIGSNVGILLEGFKRKGLRVLGIDPAPKIAEIANKREIETWNGFIDKNISELIVNKKGRAKIITATNVFAHIDDKQGLIECIKILLEEDGIFIIEAPYLVDLIENLEYDTIYLDHLEYLSLKPLIKFFEKHGFEIFDVEKYGIHGNSIRIFISRKNVMNISENVYKLLELEEKKGIYDKNNLDEFARKVCVHKKEFLELVYELKKQGKKIVGISAPAKGNTLLNYCKIHNHHIDYMTEKSKIKLGYYTPGMHIPIIEEENLLRDNADYGIIFAWNFADEIIKNPINQEFLRRGGKFIKPIPKPIIMETKIENLRKDSISINKEHIEIKEFKDIKEIRNNSGFTESDNYIEIKKDIEKTENLFGVKLKKIDPVFIDNRGIITDLLNEPIKNVGLITTEKNAIRASHYHKKSWQYSYILQGKFEVLIAPYDQPINVKKIVINPGELITIPPLVIHQFKAIEKAIMINMESESRAEQGYEDDTIRVKIYDKSELNL